MGISYGMFSDLTAESLCSGENREINGYRKVSSLFRLSHMALLIQIMVLRKIHCPCAVQRACNIDDSLLNCNTSKDFYGMQILKCYDLQ